MNLQHRKPTTVSFEFRHNARTMPRATFSGLWTFFQWMKIRPSLRSGCFQSPRLSPIQDPERHVNAEAGKFASQGFGQANEGKLARKMLGNRRKSPIARNDDVLNSRFSG